MLLFYHFGPEALAQGCPGTLSQVPPGTNEGPFTAKGCQWGSLMCPGWRAGGMPCFT